MIFTSDLFNQYTTKNRDRALTWTVWFIRLQISIFRRNLVIFDQFILSLVEIYDIAQWVSLTLNWLLNELHWFKYNKLHDSYLLYNLIVSPNVLSLPVVLYERLFSRLKLRRVIVDIFLLFARCEQRDNKEKANGKVLW